MLSTLPPADKTLVRFVHASPDAGSVDVAVDGTTVLSGVTFGTASSYLEVAPGERTVEVLKGGEAVLTLDPELEAGTKITAYVTGNAAPEEGNASLGATTTLEAVNPSKTVRPGPDRGPAGPNRGRK